MCTGPVDRGRNSRPILTRPRAFLPGAQQAIPLYGQILPSCGSDSPIGRLELEPGREDLATLETVRQPEVPKFATHRVSIVGAAKRFGGPDSEVAVLP